MTPFAFPRWANRLCTILGIVVFGVSPVYFGLLMLLGASPETTDVGYKPIQPVTFSHVLHVSELNIDCRYCHSSVEQGAFATLPPSSTCMSCHKTVRMTSARLLGIRESYVTGEPVRWVKVHDLQDFVYFDHSVHARSGVGCVSCHGRIDQMAEVRQAKTLTMRFCVDCHKLPDPHLRPVEEITNMVWKPEGDGATLGRRLRTAYRINPSTDCSICHR
jgi:hypothetical protein